LPTERSSDRVLFLRWDALPEAAKIQIVLGIGFLEWWSELRLEPGAKHYMKVRRRRKAANSLFAGAAAAAARAI